MKKIKLLFLIAMAAVMASCGSSSIYVDNPTGSELTVSFDGKEPIKVAALECKKLDGMKAGEHTMKVNGTEELKLTIGEGAGIINPTKATYVIVKEQYGVGLSNLEVSKITLGEDTYEGPFTSDNGLFISIGGVNYNLTENFPDEVQMDRGQSKATRSKIFRAEDFIKYFDAR